MLKSGMLALCVATAGCGSCNQPVPNPVSPDYPCGTRARVCSTAPALSCCWLSEDCGGAVGSSCPAGMCCYGGESLAASSDGGAKGSPSPQWTPR